MDIKSKPYRSKDMGNQLALVPRYPFFKRIKHLLLCHKKCVVSRNFNELSDFIYDLPSRFDHEGEVIFKVRNELRRFVIDGKAYIVKSYCQPNIINRVAYGSFRPSKATRSYVYALRLLDAEIGTPAPVGYCETYKRGLLDRSFFVSRESDCKHEFRELLNDPEYPNRDNIIKAVAEFAAKLHDRNFLPMDFSSGNILFEDNGGEDIVLEMVDLNRMRFRIINMFQGCASFHRLDLEERGLRLLASSYARVRNMDSNDCQEIVLNNRDSRMKNYGNIV